MSKKKLFIFILSVSSLIVFTQGSCNHSASSQDILVYTFKGSEQMHDAAVLHKQKPAMMLKKSNIEKVELTRYQEKLFTLKLDLMSNAADEFEKITSENIGKRIAFVKGSKILFSPFILAAVKKPEIVIELSIDEQDAKDIAGNFDKSYVFIDKRPFISTDVKMALELRDKREFAEAIKILKITLNKADDPEEKIYLYSALWTCYWAKKDYGNAAKAYELLVKQPIIINYYNSDFIGQAYSYLIGFELKQGDTKKADYYAQKLKSVMEYIINNYPLTHKAQWINLGLSESELYEGNVNDAEKRARLAIKGDLRTEGYMHLAACYEYQNKYKDAEKIYKMIIKIYPQGSAQSLLAQSYLNSLKHNKSEIKEEIKKYKRGDLFPD